MEVLTRDDIALGRVELRGSMNIYASGELHAGLTDLLRTRQRLELDLSGVDEIDFSGVQLLIAAKRAAGAQGHALHLVAHSSAVLEALELCHLLGFFGDLVVETVGVHA